MSFPVPAPASTPDPWQALRSLTDARIALGRSGGSLPVAEVLDFRLAHAEARDAVLMPFDAAGLAEEIRAPGVPVLRVASAAESRRHYLQRPDLGRRLAAASREMLLAFAAEQNLLEMSGKQSAPGADKAGGLATPGLEAAPDLVIVVGDGLSVQAMRQVPPLLAVLLPALQAAGWKLAPVVVAEQARVALQDEIGDLLHARLSLMLLGERPGLDSADSLGAYFTWAPRPGRTDAERNCLSNIRAAGLPPAAAAHRLFQLLTTSRTLGLSGTALKDDAPLSLLPPALGARASPRCRLRTQARPAVAVADPLLYCRNPGPAVP